MAKERNREKVVGAKGTKGQVLKKAAMLKLNIAADNVELKTEDVRHGAVGCVGGTRDISIYIRFIVVVVVSASAI